MLHIISKLEKLKEADLKRPNTRYFHRDRTHLLPTELFNRGFSLISLEEEFVGDPVILKDRKHRIVAYWDTYPSLTELFELVERLKNA